MGNGSRWAGIAAMMAILSACSAADGTRADGAEAAGAAGAAGKGNDSEGDKRETAAGAEAPIGADDGAVPDDGMPPQTQRGAAVALSPDDKIAVAVNRDSGSATVLRVGYDHQEPSLELIDEVEFGEGSQPFMVVIAKDGETAFVILRKEQRVVKIRDLSSKPRLDGSVSVGSEPTAIALSPSGKRGFVANWVDGTVTEFDTASLEVKYTINLNAALVDTGYLGDVKARPALAHPRSVALSNDGDDDDDDESLFVTEYFGQQAEEEKSDGSNADTFKVGLVYRVSLYDREVHTIEFGALLDMGFKDANGNAAGCYPNQVQSIALHGPFAYVVSVCASPEGPLGIKATTTTCEDVEDCGELKLQEPACIQPTATAPASICVDVAGAKTTTAPLISVIDTRKNLEVAGSARSLNAEFDALFRERKIDAASQRFPLFANNIAFLPGRSVAYVTANGSDAVFRLRFDPKSGELYEVGATQNPFINLAPAGIALDKAGKNPISIAILQNYPRFAIVANDVSRNASLLDFNTQAISGGVKTPLVIATTAQPDKGSDAEAILRGKRFFNTGLVRWSLRGQGWGSCQSCHGDGLTDNVTWYFARGPRQSVSLDGSFASTHAEDQRLFNWTAIKDQVADFEDNARDISGGVGAIVSAVSDPLVTADRIDFVGLGHANLNGSSADAADPENPLELDPSPKIADWKELERFIQVIRSPRAPSNLDADKVAAGRESFLYQGGCQGCHGGEKWTISQRFYTPSTAVGAALLTTKFPVPDGFPTALLPAQNPDNQTLRFQGGNAAAFDQILCAVRPVGTFNVAEPGVGIAELRADMMTPAQGAGNPEGEGAGYNPPSLLGVAIGGPYFHAGNARTLEALLGQTFETHYAALAPNYLTYDDQAERDARVSELVQFMLSIDEDTKYVDIPEPGARGGSLCIDPMLDDTQEPTSGDGADSDGEEYESNDAQDPDGNSESDDSEYSENY
jgi:mono/diheme cytochrome c family protein